MTNGPASALMTSPIAAERLALQKLPPHDLPTEAAVLGAIILGAEGSTAILNQLSSATFYRSTHKTIIRTLAELHAAGKPLTEAVVKSALEDVGLSDAAAELPKITGSAYQWTSGEPAKAPSPAEIAEHVDRLVRMAKLRAMIRPLTDATRAAYEPGSDPSAIAATMREELTTETNPGGWMSLQGSIQTYGCERLKAVVENLLREGEILTVSAPAKTGKSFILQGLALSIASGRDWLHPQWRCTPGKVALIDAELSQNEFNYRMKAVLTAMKLPPETAENIMVLPLWGKRTLSPEGIFGELRKSLQAAREFTPKLVAIDPLYQFIPEGGSENDNALLGSIFRHLNTAISAIPGCAGTVIHHTTKGGQGDKAVVDVGRGASAIGGGTSTHMVLREHDEEGVFVAEARCRSWPTPEPVTLRFQFPLWTPTAHDVTHVKGRPRTHARPPDELSDATFTELLDKEPKSKKAIVRLLRSRHSYSRDDAENLIDSVIDRHNLDNLHKDQQKDCGPFIAAFGGNGTGFRFQLKIITPANRPVNTVRNTVR